jgi:hypothetical protein
MDCIVLSEINIDWTQGGGLILKNKNLLLYLSSFLLLFIGFVLFVITKFSHREELYLSCSIICIILFCIANRVTDKKIQCKDGYNLFQAYLFYKKCNRAGVKAKASKLKKNDLQIIADVAKKYDYCKNFTDEQLKELYRRGEEI